MSAGPATSRTPDTDREKESLESLGELSAYQQLRSIIGERTGRFIIWVGSGLSREAELPDWKGLKEALLDEFRARIGRTSPDNAEQLHGTLKAIERIPNMWIAFEQLEDALGVTTFQACIRHNLSLRNRKPVPKAYVDLWRLPVDGFINMNLDTLAEQAFQQAYNDARLVKFTGHISGKYTHLLSSNIPFLCNIHGSIDISDSWVLTKKSLEPVSKP